MKGAWPLVLLLASTTVSAQAWPTKPIRIIHPNPAGGPPDVQFRGITPMLAQSLGQPFVIDNRVGADGLIGAEAFAKSAPDGYTLTLIGSQVVVGGAVTNPKLPFNVDRDFAPILQTGEFASAVVVNPAVPASSLQELIALAKSKPDTVAWAVGSASPITTSILYVQWFKAARDVHFFPVPYKSTTQALSAVVSGETHLTVYAIGQALSLAKSGKVKALAVIGDKRSPYLPDVPSLKEQGVEMYITSFFGLFARGGTPDPIIRRLNGEIRRVLEQPDVREKYTSALGMVYEPMSPEEFGAYVRKQRVEFAQLAKLIGLKSVP